MAINDPGNIVAMPTSSSTKVKPAFTPANINQHLVYSRAFNAVIWGMPAVNFELFNEALTRAKGDFNQVVYWSGLLTSKNQTLTPNPDVIYVNPFYDTRQGPIVLEIPPAEGVSSITGSLDDAWQTAIEDIGPAGVDKGKGGKYLILPPGYQEKVPDGYIALRSDTNMAYALLRSNVGSGSEADVAKAVAYARQIKLYPLSQAASPQPTAFVDAIDTVYDSTIPYDLRFF